jgi:Domain of unknown function, B. Theta Gene description (DUF3873)
VELAFRNLEEIGMDLTSPLYRGQLARSRGTDMQNEHLRPNPWPPLGQERYHDTFARRHGRRYVEYAYRTPDGRLFTAVLPTLAECQAARNTWLVQRVAAAQRAAETERAQAEARDHWQAIDADLYRDSRTGRYE